MVGGDGGLLERAVDRAVRALGEPGYGHLLGVAVRVGDRELVGGPAPDRATDCFSVTKTVLAWATQEAVSAGVLGSLDDVVGCARAAGRRAVVRDLLGMRQAWTTTPDTDALEAAPDDPLPALLAALGDGRGPVRYADAGMHLLARELDLRTGSLAGFVDEHVLRPAGVTAWTWDRDQTGVPWGHAHLHLSVRDLARLGAARLHDPLPVDLDGTVPPAVPPEGLPWAAGRWTGDGWTMAAGWGGQCLMLLPRHDAVLAVLGATGWDAATGTDTLAPGWRTGRGLLETHLVPALRDAGTPSLPDEVDALLGTLTDRLHQALGPRLVGLYLHGSWVAGDADLARSDVDLLAVLSPGPDEDLLPVLREAHDAVEAAHPAWRGRVEVEHVGLGTLRRHAAGDAPVPPDPIARVSPGEELHLLPATPHRVLTWAAVHDGGRALVGAPAAEVLPAFGERASTAALLEHVRDWPTWVQDMTGAGGQAYAVLTLCRAAVRLDSGRQVSKKAAADLVAATDPAWAGTVRWARDWWYAGGADDAPPRTAEVRRFVEETSARLLGSGAPRDRG